jgi:hypothetical protein
LNIKHTILLVQVVEAAADFVEVGHGHVGDVGHVPGDKGIGVQLVVAGGQEVQLARARQLAAEVGNAGVGHRQTMAVARNNKKIKVVIHCKVV